MNPIMNSTNNNVLNFMDEVDRKNALDAELKTLSEDPIVKLRKLNKTKEDGVNTCITTILTKICNNAIPEVNGRTPEVKDLDKVVSDYISRRTGGQDASFYVKEALKRNPNNTALKSMIESVHKLVNEKYFEKECNPSTIKEEDYTFQMTPQVEDGLEKIIRDNSLDDLAEAIKDNVRDTAINEVELAKKEKEERKKLEEELMNDPTITNEATLEAALASRGLNQTTIYQPSLFNAVMMNAFKHATYNLTPFTECVDMAAYTEGFLDKIKANFQAKKAEKAKESMAMNAPGFTAAIEAIYKQTYGVYRGNISSIDMEKIEKAFKEALKNQSGSLMVKLPDVDSYKKTVEEYKGKVKTGISNRSFYSEKLPKCPYVSISAEDALAQAKSSIKTLDSTFSKPDMAGFVKKYTNSANGYANRQESAKQVEKVYDSMTKLALANAQELISHMDFVDGFVTYAKSLIAHDSGSAVKEAAFDKAITEFTLLNISKAMKLEDFNLAATEKLALEYAQN